MHNIIAPSIAIASVISAALSGFNFVQIKLTPDLIEGYGIAPDFVFAGVPVNIEWYITKRTICPGFVGRVWTGQDGFYLTEPKRLTGLPKTDSEKLHNVQTMIPVQAPAGELELIVKGYYDCEGKERKYYDLGPVTFNVITEPTM